MNRFCGECAAVKTSTLVTPSHPQDAREPEGQTRRLLRILIMRAVLALPLYLLSSSCTRCLEQRGQHGPVADGQISARQTGPPRARAAAARCDRYRLQADGCRPNLCGPAACQQQCGPAASQQRYSYSCRRCVRPCQRSASLCYAADYHNVRSTHSPGGCVPFARKHAHRLWVRGTSSQLEHHHCS